MRLRDNVIHVIVYLLVAVALFHLFSNQAAGIFKSDLLAHLEDAISPFESSYSLMALIYRGLYLSVGIYGVVWVLILIELLTLALTEYLLKVLLGESIRSYIVILLCALALNFLTAIYLPMFHIYLFSGILAPNEWANGTYLFMRPFALLSILSYLRITQYVKNETLKANWIAFFLSTALSVAFKPAYFVALIPSLIVLCIVDLYKDRKTLRRSLGFAGCLLVMLVLIAFQYEALYGGSNEGSKLAFGFLKLWGIAHDNVALAIVQSLAFPLIVFIGLFSKARSDRNWHLALLLTLFGLIEYAFFYEDGPRFVDANLSWSARFATYYLFIVALVELIKDRASVMKSSAKSEASSLVEEAGAKGRLGRFDGRYLTVYILAWLAFAAHVLSGILYFVLISLGYSPWS